MKAPSKIPPPRQREVRGGRRWGAISSSLRALTRKLGNRTLTIYWTLAGRLVWHLESRFERHNDIALQTFPPVADSTAPMGTAGEHPLSDFLLIPETRVMPAPLLNLGESQNIYFSPTQRVAIGRNQVFFSHRLYPSLTRLRREELLALAGDARYRSLTFMRTYGIGDVIIVLPLLRMFKRLFPEKIVRLATRESFAPLLDNDTELVAKPLADEFTRVQVDGDELFVDLDHNTFESDRSLTHPFRNVHRTDILYYLFDVPAGALNYDYSIALSAEQLDQGHKALGRLKLRAQEYLIFAWEGSTPIKTLDPSIKKEFLRRLADHYPILVVNPQPVLDRFGHANVKWIDGLQIMQLMALVRLSRVACVMDSGMLWFAHAMKTPTVCLLGPTPEQTRLSKHPLYPSKAKVVNLYANVGCLGPCYTLPESGWCKGRISCMKDLDLNVLVGETLSAIAAVSPQ